ncbi:MAG: hypothetical protein QOI31_1846 [Solirubrobacterales bacterium]|nr:hypothetical protein [Solirubrobacterales bacterium]
MRYVASLLVLSALAAPGIAGAAPLYPPDTTLTRVRTPRDVPRPGYLQPVLDPSFGTTVTRVADEEAFDQEGFGVIRHAYAKNQPWNADGSLLMLDWRRPAPLLDGETFELIGRVHQPSEAMWMHTDPRYMIGRAGSKLVRWDAIADERDAVIHRFDEYSKIQLGAGEGNMSNDDRYIALFGRHGDDTDVVVFDLVEEQVLSTRTFENSGVKDGQNASTFNNVAMSQSGERVVVEFNAQGRGLREGIQSYDLDLRNRVPLSANGGTHFDVCVDSEGDDTIVTQADARSAIISADLTDGTRTVLLPASLIAYPIHVSCRNTERPGWAYLSEYFDSEAPRLANYDEVFAVRMDGSGTIQRFAHEHHSRNESYEREPHAVPSPDGSRVLWASDWERERGPVYAYVAERR